MGHGRAQDILEHFLAGVGSLELKRVLQVSMDGPNVNWAFHKLLQSKMHNEFGSQLLDIGSCGLHVINLQARQRCVLVAYSFTSAIRSLAVQRDASTAWRLHPCYWQREVLPELLQHKVARECSGGRARNLRCGLTSRRTWRRSPRTRCPHQPPKCSSWYSSRHEISWSKSSWMPSSLSWKSWLLSCTCTRQIGQWSPSLPATCTRCSSNSWHTSWRMTSSSRSRWPRWPRSTSTTPSHASQAQRSSSVSRLTPYWSSFCCQRNPRYCYFCRMGLIIISALKPIKNETAI